MWVFPGCGRTIVQELQICFSIRWAYHGKSTEQHGPLAEDWRRSARDIWSVQSVMRVSEWGGKHTHTQHDANEIVFISIKTLRHRSRHPLQQIPFTTKRRKAGQEATSSHCFHRYEYLSNILTQSTFSVCLKKLLSIAVAVARWFWFFYGLSCTCPIA